jgi:aminoglycoside 2''-phosphotransferase
MRSIARQVGRFLSELHSFPVERAAALGVPVYSPEGWRQHYVEFYEKVRPLVLPLLSPGEAASVESFWRDLLGGEEHFAFSPALIHRDLDDAHMLVDSERIVGVIDFGDVCIGDQALDFAGCEGAFREEALTAYGASPEVHARLSARADAYRKIGPFHAVIYGIEGNHAEWLQRGVEAVRARLATD